MSYLAIVLTVLTALFVGAPVAQASDCYRSRYSSYRRYAPPQRYVSARLTVANRRGYWRTRPSYTYVRGYTPRYSRFVRVYSSQPYRVVNRYVAYGRTCY
jgi:hypothetical protein